MKTLTTLITVLFISLLSSPSLSETVFFRDLEERDGLFYYKKFSSTLFTGEVENNLLKLKMGTIKNGKPDGLWETYYWNGQVHTSSIYKDGILNGLHEWYYENGQLWFEENYKNGIIEDSIVIWYYENGSQWMTKTYKDGELIDVG